ncbi:MAG: YceD family protein [Solirubrobacteraceae bacterium]
MAQRSDTLDLAGLRLGSGEGRRLELAVAAAPLSLGSERYGVAPDPVPVAIDVSRTAGGGYALRLAFGATLSGPCMRCLSPAAPSFDVEAREVDQPGAGEELESPYVRDGALDVRAWARDALALSVPAQLLCRPDCAGLCPVCGVDLNLADDDHAHEPGTDPRWAKLSELRFN